MSRASLASRPDAGTITLRFRDRRVALDRAVTVIGRHTDCDVLLDGNLISRRHAAVRIVDFQGSRTVEVEDLGSRNGVYVNGERIDVRSPLRVGDRLTIGDEEAVLVADGQAADRAATKLRQAMTLTGLDANPDGFSVEADTAAIASGIQRPGPAAREGLEDDASSPEVADSETRAATTLGLMEPVFEKAMRLNRPQEAKRYVERQIVVIVESLRKGRPVSHELAVTASKFATRLAEALGEGHLANLAVEIHALRHEAMPLDCVDRLHQVVRRTADFDRSQLRDYVASLESDEARLGPADRFAVKRLKGLLQVASL